MNATLLLTRAECGLRSRITLTLGALAGLAILSVALMYASVGVAAQAGFGPSAGGLINIFMLIVPLVALMFGALCVVRDRERGTLGYFFVQPVSIGAIFWSKWLTLALQLAAVVCGAFLAMLGALALIHVPNDPASMAQFMGATVLLAIAMGSCGLLISILARSTPLALAIALGAWLLFVVFADIGAMAGALATHMSTQTLLAATVANPIEAFKVAAICALSGSVDVLGPGGRLANDMFGVYLMPVMITVMIGWAALMTVLGRMALERQRHA